MDAYFFQSAHCGNSYLLLAALQQLIRLAISCANLLPVSLPPKETGAYHTAAALLARAFAAFPPRDNQRDKHRKVTSNSDADDSAAAQGMDCT